ncbi:MAG: hypothetical protein R3F11_11195 [Verrucomicrobiales bacterium]
MSFGPQQSTPIRRSRVPLRKVYAAYGNRRGTGFDPTCGQDWLSLPSELRREGSFIHFLRENQSCWSAAYPIDGGDDPPVFLFDDDGYRRQEVR